MMKTSPSYACGCTRPAETCRGCAPQTRPPGSARCSCLSHTIERPGPLGGAPRGGGPGALGGAAPAFGFAPDPDAGPWVPAYGTFTARVHAPHPGFLLSGCFGDMILGQTITGASDPESTGETDPDRSVARAVLGREPTDEEVHDLEATLDAMGERAAKGIPGVNVPGEPLPSLGFIAQRALFDRLAQADRERFTERTIPEDERHPLSPEALRELTAETEDGGGARDFRTDQEIRAAYLAHLREVQAEIDTRAAEWDALTARVDALLADTSTRVPEKSAETEDGGPSR